MTRKREKLEFPQVFWKFGNRYILVGWQKERPEGAFVKWDDRFEAWVIRDERTPQPVKHPLSGGNPNIPEAA